MHVLWRYSKGGGGSRVIDISSAYSNKTFPGSLPSLLDFTGCAHPVFLLSSSAFKKFFRVYLLEIGLSVILGIIYQSRENVWVYSDLMP